MVVAAFTSRSEFGLAETVAMIEKVCTEGSRDSASKTTFLLSGMEEFGLKTGIKNPATISNAREIKGKFFLKIERVNRALETISKA